MYDEKLRRRFAEKYAEVSSGCWEWQAGKNASGYGSISQATYGEQLAHRLAYRLSRGDIVDGLHVLHSCDNRACVNPAHLFLGTNADNVADRQAKGRGKLPPPLSRDEHPQTRFKQVVVDDMVRRWRAGETQASIGVRYGATQNVISKILRSQN